MNDRPASPCVSICALDNDDVCIGCFRTGGEISYWGLLPPVQQHEVISRCAQRMRGEYSPCVMEEGRDTTHE